MADVNTNTATQTQEQGNGTQTNTTANTTGAGADNTPKVKTEEEIRAELQKEYEKMADKRVTDAIKKKEKEWADKQAKEKMTEDERRQAEEQERLLNSVCRVIASAYSGVPVHIEEVPNNFERNSFYVTLATGSSELKNINVYEDDPIFQIVYFAKRNEANQVVAEKLYEVKEELKRLFLLKRVVPVIPLAGVKEKPRYAKIENYSDDVRVSEGALYVKITLNFTEDVPVEDNYELIGDVDIETKTVTNG